MAREYDPQERRERYLRERELKGRKSGSKVAKSAPKKPKVSDQTKKNAAERVVRLKSKVNSLQANLTETLAALSEKRASATKEKRENSDGKSTAEERKASKEYRARNKSKIAEKRKKGSKDESSPKTLSSMSVDELQSRVTKLRSTIKTARSQLAEAMRVAGQIQHSSDLSDASLFIELSDRKESVQMSHKKADFGGWATRYDVECTDGRTIRPDAFAHNDKKTIPIMFNHGHEDNTNVLGHGVLEHRPGEGVYIYGYLNDTVKGAEAKIQVKHGDLTHLSIYANQLKEKMRDAISHAKDVYHGNIREVSLVLAGANPGAHIDNPSFAHSDGSTTTDITEGHIYVDTPIEPDVIQHSTTVEEDRSLQDIIDSLDEDQERAVAFLLSQALTGAEEGAKHSDLDEDEAGDEDEEQDSEDAEENEEDADADSEDSEDDEEVDEENVEDDAVTHSNQEDNSMSHNVFDGTKDGTVARHSVDEADVKSIIGATMKHGSMKDAIEGYALKHGIENIDYLFPDAQTMESSPQFLSRRMEWVDKVLGGVRKSPISRIKTITADITPDEARARGYIKGNMKNEEFFALSKRETTPQTIYKKQRLDRDDILDITTLDVVAWLKAEMKVMLDEELAGAILIGDGRSIGDEDKIKESNIRPIATDAELYVTTAYINLDDANSSIEELVDAAIANRRYYKGTGQPAFFTSEAIISAFLTVKDGFGRRIYANLTEVASVLRVSEVVPVEILDRDETLVGIMVNLTDYVLGADKAGQATMFDDFDIDYNKHRYLIETRVSGALVQPKSAIVFRRTDGANVLAKPLAPVVVDNDLTVPTVTGVVYKSEDGTTLTTGDPVELTPQNSPYIVTATPASGYYFANNQNDEWIFNFED